MDETSINFLNGLIDTWFPDGNRNRFGVITDYDKVKGEFLERLISFIDKEYKAYRAEEKNGND